MQWIPSHVGLQGNEHAHEGAARGSAQAFREVLHDGEVRDMWHDLGLEEMDEDRDLSGGSGASVMSNSKSSSLDTEFHSHTSDLSLE